VNIRRDFFRFVRADSSAVIKRKFGVVGDAYFVSGRKLMFFGAAHGDERFGHTRRG